MIRHERNMEIRSEDIEFLQTAISFLNGIFPIPEEDEEEVREIGAEGQASKDQEDAQLQILKRRVEEK